AYRRLAAVAAAATLLGGVGCGRGRETAPSSKPKPALMLFCGAGIQLPVAELAEAFSKESGCRIDADYAGSEVLLSRIKLKQKGDLYMPGDASYVEMAASAGMIESSTPACYFVPTILVARGSPKKITGLQDLTRQGVRLGLGDAKACAVGRQSKKVFDKNGIAWADVERRLVFQSLTVNELGVQIQTGSLDAVIVWDAVARQYLDHGEMVEIPPEQNVISTVPIGVLRFSEHKDLANRFVEFAVSDRGRAIFGKHHYRVDPPTGKKP
ncbi:MAG: substrate-binding domain-containing protein, partial [Phycisphaerae bacterium]|nr:substrate-binding domain-containing protein [Phycisphaerae bacterium]